MNIAIYGSKENNERCVSLLEVLPEMQYRQVEYIHVETYDDLIRALTAKPFAIIFALADGAEGMEAVIAAKKLAPTAAVIWLTNDAGFGAQSHRLGCSYFASGPITENTVRSAVHAYQMQRSS